MTGIETIALVFIAISIIKLIVLAIRPESWYGSDNPLMKIFSGTTTTIIVSLAIGMVVLFYLLQELSIVQIFAAMVFGWLILMLTMAPFAAGILDWVKRAAKEPHFFRKNSFSVIIWILLMFWVLKEVFF